jgi:hypothetical protein
VLRAHLAATLHKGMDSRLLGHGLALVDVLGPASDERFVALHDLAGAADRASGFVDLHGFADAMAEKPG